MSKDEITELNEDFDFGFTAVDSENLKDDARIAALSEGRNKVDQMYNAIMPLLKNLLKDADTTDMIKWPNRKKKIIEFVAKLDRIRNT